MLKFFHDPHTHTLHIRVFSLLVISLDKLNIKRKKKLLIFPETSHVSVHNGVKPAHCVQSITMVILQCDEDAVWCEVNKQLFLFVSLFLKSSIV